MTRLSSTPSNNAVELTIGHFRQIEQAAVGRYIYDRPMLCAVNENTVEQGAQVLEALVLQLLAAHPLGGAQLALFEPQATQRFGEIKHLLAATQGELGRQWMTPQEAKTGLQALNDRVMERASLLAAARQPHLAAYNAGRRTPEPVYLALLCGTGALVLHDPMVMYTGQHLAKEGPRCGVVVLVLHDMEATRAVPLEQKQRKLLYEMLGALVSDAFGFNLVDIAKPIPYNMGNPYQQFIADFGYTPEFKPEQLRAYSDAILSARQASAEKNPQQDFLRVKVGEAGALPAYFTLGHASYTFNALVSGGSGSGKTTFVQNLVLSICEQYAPEQIQLALLDYGTVSFGPYRGIAHVQTVFDTPRDGQRLAKLFDWFVAELHRRKDAFKACGETHNLSVDNLATYARLSGKLLPIILLVIDEFGSLINNENTSMVEVNGRAVRVSIHAEQAINLLVREGRKVGLHLILITQSFAKLDRLPQDLKSNPHLAVGLKAEQARDSTALLNQDNDAAYRIKPFQAVFNANSGQKDGNVFVDLDYVSETDIADRQAALRMRWPRGEPSPLMMFLDDSAPDGKPSVRCEGSDTPSDEPSWLRQAARKTGT